MSHPGGLKITTPTDLEIVITRSFNAPRQMVWDAMNKPELVRKWLMAPPGWTMTECTQDVRPGGRFRWAWSGPDGNPAMAMHGTYREVKAPERIVRTESFDLGCPSQADELLGTMTLTESGGRTHLTITILYPNKECRDGALASGMEQGLSAGYNNLEEMLSGARTA